MSLLCKEMSEVVQKVIDYYERLVHEHPSPQMWAINIQKAIRQLPTEISMSNFYSYLFNPDAYVYSDTIQCLTPAHKEQFEKEAKAFDEQNPLTVTTYTNLNDGKILYDCMNKLSIDNGKRMDETPRRFSKKEQRDVPEGSDETSFKILQSQSQNEEKMIDKE